MGKALLVSEWEARGINRCGSRRTKFGELATWMRGCLVRREVRKEWLRGCGHKAAGGFTVNQAG